MYRWPVFARQPINSIVTAIGPPAPRLHHKKSPPFVSTKIPHPAQIIELELEGSSSCSMSRSWIWTRHPTQIIELEFEWSSSGSNYWAGVGFELIIQLKLLSWSFEWFSSRSNYSAGAGFQLVIQLKLLSWNWSDPHPAQSIELELDLNSSSSSNYWAGVGVQQTTINNKQDKNQQTNCQ